MKREKIKWTKISKIASEIEWKGDTLYSSLSRVYSAKGKITLYSSLSRVYSAKGKITKKLAHSKETEEKGFQPSILYPNLTTVDLYRFLSNKCTRGGRYTC